ncbi:MAG: S8 family serine peptidase [Clostridiales bacterium]|nr:S8 family serine peptidase [Clostridiales bacterium]
MIIKKTACIFLSCFLAFLLCSCNYSTTVSIPNHRLQWWLDEIDWDDNRTDISGKDIKIAIIDSGVDINHNDIKDSIEKNIKVSQLDESFGDDTSHGTAVAAIISGNCKNDNGILGVATDSKIISIDVTDTSDGTVEEKNLIEGIATAIDEEVDIINISMGIKEGSAELYEIIKTAYNAGIIIVAAAGNYIESDVLYPAAYAEVICVGSKNKKGEVISPKYTTKKSVIYLPGEHISSATADNGYKSFSGTSVSTPILTGIISLMLENNPGISQEDIYDYFSETSKNIKVENCINLKKGN